MSGYLAGKVWLSGLGAELKPLAACLADIGNDHGQNIYPSVAYMAWRLSRSETHVHNGIKELKTLGVLVVIENAKGGRGNTVRYRLLESKLPPREQWRVSDDDLNESEERVQSTEERVQSSRERVQTCAPDPLVVQPLEEPLVITENEVSEVSLPRFKSFKIRWDAATSCRCPKKDSRGRSFSDIYTDACGLYGEDEVLAACDGYGAKTAEWIENEEQLAIIRTMGCDYVQGYLISPALSAEDFEEFTRSWSGRLNDKAA